MTAPDTGRVARPAILTVDDDPGVSRAVARDLRRQLRRALPDRAGRAPARRRWTRCARSSCAASRSRVLLADYRMPQMNGIEFLEPAMDLFPLARRVLLTAYADTDAAIEAINVVDLDHYLLKPWDPPEEKLYPVVDALLEAWTADPGRRPRRDPGGRAPLVGAVVRGARLPGPQPGAVPLVAAPTTPEGAAAARRGRASTATTLPLVVTADGKALVAPSEAELAASGRPDHRAGVGLLRPGRGRRRPGRARRGRVRRVARGCAPCWSSGGPPAGRPGRAAGSRTTWASRTASPARS